MNAPEFAARTDIHTLSPSVYPETASHSKEATTVTSLRRKSILVLAGAVIGVAVMPSTSLATHDIVRARRVGPGDFRWRDSETASSQTHLLSTPHRLKWRNPSNGVRHDVTFYREPAGVNVRNIGSLAPGRRSPAGSLMPRASTTTDTGALSTPGSTGGPLPRHVQGE